MEPEANDYTPESTAKNMKSKFGLTLLSFVEGKAT